MGTDTSDFNTDFDALEAALRAFAAEHPPANWLPSRAQLYAAGRQDLMDGMEAHGGSEAVALQLEMRNQDGKRRPRGYWQDDANVEAELRLFMVEHDIPEGVMPKQQEVLDAGRDDLFNGVRRSGGFLKWAQRLGLEVADHRNRAGYWDDFEVVRREVLAYVEEEGTPGLMPTYRELQEAGRFDLKYGVERNGGIYSVAERLGLNARPSSRGPK